jgi:hypothetical protein
VRRPGLRNIAADPGSGACAGTSSSAGGKRTLATRAVVTGRTPCGAASRVHRRTSQMRNPKESKPCPGCAVREARPGRDKTTGPRLPAVLSRNEPREPETSSGEEWPRAADPESGFDDVDRESPPARRGLRRLLDTSGTLILSPHLPQFPLAPPAAGGRKTQVGFASKFRSRPEYQECIPGCPRVRSGGIRRPAPPMGGAGAYSRVPYRHVT